MDFFAALRLCVARKKLFSFVISVSNQKNKIYLKCIDYFYNKDIIYLFTFI